MLEELKKTYRQIFGTEIPQLVNTDVPEEELIKLLKKSIYIDLEPLTLDDLANVVGEFDIIYESPKQR